MRASVDIRKDFDIEYPAQFEHVAGLLSVPLSSEGKDFICFCRKGQLTVRTAPLAPSPLLLMPRSSAGGKVGWKSLHQQAGEHRQGTYQPGPRAEEVVPVMDRDGRRQVPRVDRRGARDGGSTVSRVRKVHRMSSNSSS